MDGMTCLVGSVEPETGTIYIRGDSACSHDGEMSILAHNKGVRRGETLIGCAGSQRLNDLLQHVFVPPVYRPEKNNLLSFLVTDFMMAMKQALAGEHGEQ